MRVQRGFAACFPLIGVALVTWRVGSAQAERFDVAVVHRSAITVGTSVQFFDGGRVVIKNEPVKLLIRMAFDVQDSQVANAPRWVDTDRYDIEAKTDRAGRITPTELRPLMEALLADRFRLRSHVEMRSMTVQALIPASDGVRLKTSSGDINGMDTSGGDDGLHLQARATSMSLLAGYIGNRLNRVVVDKTGLTGSYDFALDWAPDERPDSRWPALVTVLREQLGLRLVNARALIGVRVIDHIDRPSDN